MQNHFFEFKNFTVRQEHCAMKVCTDACLFGAWADVAGAKRILDIGTGTGLLSLMAAQRNSEALVEGVEIDEGAFIQAGQNFKAGPFGQRLSVHHAPVQAFFPEYRFDAIISNPPFFQNDLKSPDRKTNTAHHADTLDFSALSHAVERLLSPGGKFSLLLPVPESRLYEKQQGSGWQLTRDLLLTHRPGLRPFRRMMTFARAGEAEDAASGRRAGRITEELYIYEENDKNYDSAFKEYLKAFYLAF